MKTNLKIDCAYDELLPIEDVLKRVNPRNPNTHPENQLELLVKIMGYQGCRSAIVLSKRSGLIVKGHARLEALRRLGATQVPVDWQDYSDEGQEFADMVADNELQRLSVMDFDILSTAYFDVKNLSSGFEDFLGLPDSVITFLSEQEKFVEKEINEVLDTSPKKTEETKKETNTSAATSDNQPNNLDNQTEFCYKTITFVFTCPDLYERVKSLAGQIETDHGITAVGHAILNGLERFYQSIKS